MGAPQACDVKEQRREKDDRSVTYDTERAHLSPKQNSRRRPVYSWILEWVCACYGRKYRGPSAAPFARYATHCAVHAKGFLF